MFDDSMRGMSKEQIRATVTKETRLEEQNVELEEKKLINILRVRQYAQQAKKKTKKTTESTISSSSWKDKKV